MLQSIASVSKNERLLKAMSTPGKPLAHAAGTWSIGTSKPGGKSNTPGAKHWSWSIFRLISSLTEGSARIPCKVKIPLIISYDV